MGLGAVAGASLGGAALSAGASLLGSSQAAGASKAAAGQQLQMYYANRATAQPYFTAGQTVLPNLLQVAQAGPTGGGPDYVSQAAGAVPPTMTQAELEQTPGYQFILSQGQKAVQSAAASRGLGVSGASLKGAAANATGLADATYQNQFNNAQQRFTDYLNLNTGQQGNLQNQFNRLSGVATLGENAAVQTGAQGTQAAAASGNYLNQAGLAQAAGTTGVGSAINQGVNNYLGYNALQQYLNPGGPTSGYGSSAPGTFGTSASGNPVMTGFIGNENIGSPGAYVPPV
jgi:hypothetical protein